MKANTFPDLFKQAEKHDDFWLAGAILQFTEDVVREMARRLGSTPAYVTKILRGKVNFTLSTMLKLARALGSEVQVQLIGPSEAVKKRAHAR